jgi:hypothetical protein
MARVIVPDVGDLAAASRRIGAQTVGYVKPHLFDYNSVKEVVGTAEKIASNPLVVAGIDAFRVSGRKADAEAADAMILDATATGEADALARKAAEARFRALQERRADGTAMGRASMQPAGRRGPEQAYTAPTQDRIAEPAVGERMAVPQAAPAPVAPPAPQVDRISAQQMHHRRRGCGHRRRVPSRVQQRAGAVHAGSRGHAASAQRQRPAHPNR